MKQNLFNRQFIIFCLLGLLAHSVAAQQGYVWIKGSNVIDQPGVYGTQGTTGSGNTPGARQGASSWKDANGDFWLFGGNGFDNIGNSGYLNDLWKYNVGSNTWTWMKGDNIIAQLGVYGTQGVAASSNKPGCRSLATTWIDGNGNAYLFGGYGYDATGNFGFLNDLWLYTSSSNQWTWLKGSNSAYPAGNYGTMGTAAASNVPGSRYSCASWIDAAGGNLWLYGGLGNTTTSTTAGYLNDIWKYNIGSNTWTWMGGSNLANQNGAYGIQNVSAATNNPGARKAAMCWIDSNSDFWMFGGDGYDSSATTNGNLNDLWKYNKSTGQWVWMKGSKFVNQAGNYGNPNVPAPSNNPGGRFAGISWVDGVGNFWMGFGFGLGVSSSGVGKLNDLWIYHTASNQWRWVYGGGGLDFPAVYGSIGNPSGSNIPGSRRFIANWIDNANNLWLFGGYGQALTGNPSVLNDLWKFTNCYINPVTLTITTSNTVVCAGESVTLSVSGAGNYTWSNNSTLSSIVVSPHTTSVFIASTSNSNTCVYSTTFTQSINPCTAIKAQELSQDIGVYPNPNNGAFVIKHNGTGKLILFSSIGQAVLEKELEAGQTTAVNAQLPAGVYYYSISMSSGSSVKGKLIVE